MKILIFIYIVFCINKCIGINGVIWDKASNNFVPIFSIKEFKVLQEKLFNESREKEDHKFNGENIHFVYYDEEDNFEFYDNDKKVTGICGDIWTILSEYLNFTMVLTKTHVRTIGTRSEQNNNFTGLLGMMEKKEYTIIPKMEGYAIRHDVVDFSRSLWKDRYRLFIKPYYHYKITWMLDLFSWKIWCLILIFYVILSIFSIITQKFGKDKDSKHLISSIADYFFYSFGVLCNQGDTLYTVQKNFKLLTFCISIFSWFLLTSFSSQLIIYMTQTVLVLPFENLETLLENSDYTILSEKYSVVYIAFKKNYRPIFARINEANRIEFHTNHRQMWDLACSDNKRYAVLQSEFIRMEGSTSCKLDPVGEEYFKIFIVAGMAKDFLYKKSINKGIMKLHEHGIIKVLKSRWLEIKDSKKHVTRDYAPITLDQIILLVSVYIFGLCTSIIVVIIEKIVYHNASKSRG